jgi:predicted ATPase with chaperone activity
MLAQRLTMILPTMIPPEAIETMRIHCLAGRTGPARRWPLLTRFAPRIIRSRMSQARDEAITPL